MQNRIILAALASVALASASHAAVPQISGKYATNYSEICQQNNPNIPVKGVGATYNQILVANFDPSTGTVTLTGTAVYGPLTGNYTALTQSSVSQSGTYSNTANTLTMTLSGQTATFNVAYGPVKKGVAQSAVFGGIDFAGCAASGTAIRQ